MFSTDINFTQLEALLSESHIQEIKKKQSRISEL